MNAHGRGTVTRVTIDHIKKASKRILDSGGPDLSFYFQGELFSTSIDVNSGDDIDNIDICLTELVNNLNEILEAENVQN